jgi:hypothetical protein
LLESGSLFQNLSTLTLLDSTTACGVEIRDLSIAEILTLAARSTAGLQLHLTHALPRVHHHHRHKLTFTTVLRGVNDTHSSFWGVLDVASAEFFRSF